MKLTERISRNNIDDQIYLGELVEKATRGEFGDLLRLLINGISDDQMNESLRNHNMPADRFLGRMEGLKILQDKLILMIDLKTSLQEDKRSSGRVNSAESD
jgi:hypothetical protein